MNAYNRRSTSFLPAVLVAGLLICTVGCGVYFNTFFNARKAFNTAEKARRESASGRGGLNDYQTAIEKSRKVVDNHPNSKYYDDALFILGVSYYHTEQYVRAERRFRELLANYGDAEFASEARVYLAKTKLELSDVDEAMVLFEEIFESAYDKGYKAQAALALGEFRFDDDQFAPSRSYFMAVRDSLGDENEAKQAQMYIADGYFKSFRFGEALGAYLQVLGMTPDKNEEYHALFRSAICSYRLLKIEDGMAYLQRLMDNELYYDSLSVLQLMVAEGYEFEDDLALAEETYREVATGAENKAAKGKAYYRLGLIYQYDYDDLKKAKEYYDEAVGAYRGSEWGREALQKSSDIGKLETFTRSSELDSTATQDDIDAVAYAQYLLAELYWFQLNKADSAILEMQYLIDSFPTAYDAPQAMIGLSQMYRENYEDDEAADSILKAMLERYPHSDFVPDALDILGLRGTAADTGYAALYIHRAEDFLVDEEEYDSAQLYYQYVIDSFPDSRYYLQARFNHIWATEMYRAPGDSSVVLAYRELIDSFPRTDQADEARKRLQVRPTGSQARQRQEQQPEEGTEVLDTVGTPVEDTAGDYMDPRVTLYIGPEGDTLTDIVGAPTLIEEPFELPTEAYTMQDEAFYLYFQILVDFSGKVIDHVMKIPSQFEEVNRRASETVASMTFDALQVSELVARFDLKQTSDGRGYWLVYKFLVEKPEFLR
ncbi:MAG TPA: tetratricopeptide repeat protein [Acidobacteriota bacterium]|nr:tetratricopeptide repeat protein [Acidobacteriota bacterium]